MFWVSMGCFFALIAILVLDWSRLREWLPVAFAGSLYAGMFNALPFLPPFHLFTDAGPITDHWAIELITQLTVYPTLAAWYVQGLRPAGPPPLVRTVLFTALGLVYMLVTQTSGKAEYYTPPATWAIGIALGYVLVWGVYTYCNASQPAATEADEPGVR